MNETSFAIKANASDLSSVMSPMSLSTILSSRMSTYSADGLPTEKPYADFSEVQVAILIDRIYVPIIVTVGVLGNFLCFVTLVFSSLRHTSTCVYMAVIAVLDCAILFVVLGFLLGGYLGHTKFYMGSDWTCGLHYFLFYFCIHLDVLLLLAMTVDRFIVVKFPLKAQGWCTPKSAIKVIAGLGVFSFALNFQVFFHRRLVPTGRAEDPFWCWYLDPEVKFFMKKIYTWIDASIYSFIPFLSLLVLNLLIIRQLKLSFRFSQQFTEVRDRKVASSKANVSETITDRDSCNSNKNTYNSEPRSENENNTSTISNTKTNTNEGGGLGSATKSTTNTNITLMLLLVSFTFLALTSPIVIMLLYKRYFWLPSTNSERAQARLTHAFVDNLMYTNHAINFLLYCLSGRRFRQELKRLVIRLRCC